MRIFALTMLAVLLSASLSPAMEEEEKGMNVGEIVFCTSVEDMVPRGESSQFFNSVDKIYCFTRINGATDTTSVTHVWYYNDKEMASVKLPVKSPFWRTWSSKRMIDSWDGTWRVDVISPEDKVMASREFIYKPLKE